MARRWAGVGVLAAVLAAAPPACTQFPELDAADPARATPADDPRLVPLAPILDRAAETRATADTPDTLEARAEALRRKAAALRTRSF